MRALLAVIFALLPMVQAQDSRLLKAVEPKYAEFSPYLLVDFETSSASVTMTVMANGQPLSLDRSSVPLPIAVVMALKDYEFSPQSAGPHGQGETEVGTYQVTLNVPVRQSKAPLSAIRVNDSIMKGLLVKQVRPEYPEFARHNRLQGTITFSTLIDAQGEPQILTASGNAFVLIEAAYRAVQQWRWRGYLLNREPVEVIAEVPVVFN